LINHYLGELPGFERNLERASKIAYDKVTSESPQQQEPNLQMASNTCSYLIIHPDFQPFHLNASHSNISFGIALRNLANQKSSAYENHHFFSEDSTLLVQPLNVAASSEAIMIESDYDEEDLIMCDQPSTSSQNFEPSTSEPQTIDIPYPPTHLLDSIILKEVSENIFEDLTKLVKARYQVIPSNIFEELWNTLRERVNYVMFEMMKLSQ